MKKTYQRPLLFAETFELREHIAGDCNVNDGFVGASAGSDTTCTYSDKNMTLFANESIGCETFWFTDFDVPPSRDNLDAAGIKLNCNGAFLSGQLFAS